MWCRSNSSETGQQEAPSCADCTIHYYLLCLHENNTLYIFLRSLLWCIECVYTDAALHNSLVRFAAALIETVIPQRPIKKEHGSEIRPLVSATSKVSTMPG